ncbi:RNA-directed DNA polymerase [Clostridium beijerinckii]|uniref:RNA-directed DNA polymerase n=1 Tax=Clostridium beijerinckii TaxID=1520 RepID=A0AAW3WA47_CLOBE|nr:RNA-directed DNA polymerase [Clostridium beijerinckii]MBC2457019.1 RNA-directed DNA polymerase [Clostridium beijerinckii]MBC2475591.1 RNA-directed DNA polymerase [Clostridium beijerinckii]NOV63107.1 hypothetical protein [Clostridium beijerinckii]NOV69931.1 hypothetical protein [Clostridium beijerinckii]NOW31162.1 hypothetical protein [Clostridium beijerinckii]
MDINIQKALIKKGYFPDELGFWFSSNKFAEKCDQLNRNVTLNNKKISKSISYSIPKGKFHRRTLGIPNPYNYFFLCQEIHNSWTDIELHLDKSDISLTTPVFKSGTNRAISRKYSFEDISRILVIKSIGANYVLKTDISRYYSTIYTHSIPWALHTKQIAKKNRKDELLGNRLDQIIRNSQDGQTIGIPIGPDTSLIISEIIGVAMDKQLLSDVNYISAFRYVDDYYIFYKEKSEANKTLAKLQSILNEFQLEQNREKTNIYDMPQSIEPQWVSEINNIALNNDNIISFINIIYSLISKNPNEEVLKYALNKLKKINVNKKNWILVQSFILNSVLYDSSALPLACSILSDYYYKRFGIDNDKILKTATAIIQKALESNSDYEIVWSLWLTYLFRVKLADDMILKICSIENPIIALILLFLYPKEKLDTSKWEELMIAENLYSEYWILAYEALVRGWLPSKNGDDYIENDQFFKKLKSYGINFFDTNCKDNWVNNNIDEKWLPVFSAAF